VGSKLLPPLLKGALSVLSAVALQDLGLTGTAHGVFGERRITVELLIAKLRGRLCLHSGPSIMH
jgi:hypothetical protein